MKKTCEKGTSAGVRVVTSVERNLSQKRAPRLGEEQSSRIEHMGRAQHALRGRLHGPKTSDATSSVVFETNF